MEFARESGILLPIAALPGPYGIGELGPEAMAFADRLAEMGQHIWHLLPLGPTGDGVSPFTTLSAFAGNPLLISFELLMHDRLLEPAMLADFPALSARHIDFSAMIPARRRVLNRVCDAFDARASAALKQDFLGFKLANDEGWLDPFALFIALREHFGGQPWFEWPEEYRRRQPQALAAARVNMSARMERVKIRQYLFFRQWRRLAKHCHQRQIHLMVDIPHFQPHDSADAWVHSHLFKLDSNGLPLASPGLPPDPIHPTGQKWPELVHDWDAHERDGFRWWLRRLTRALDWLQILRLQHFRGFESHWEIPCGAASAAEGRWIAGPRDRFFAALQASDLPLPIFADDFGYIPPEVDALSDRFGLPSSRVLQFLFHKDPSSCRRQPSDFPTASICYTGTFERDSRLCWYQAVGHDNHDPHELSLAVKRLSSLRDDERQHLHSDLIQLALHCPSRTCIVLMQDLLGQGAEFRLALAQGDASVWNWRFDWDQLTPTLRENLRRSTEQARRCWSRTALLPLPAESQASLSTTSPNLSLCEGPGAVFCAAPFVHSLPHNPRHQQLSDWYDEIHAVILSRQNPISGLFPASTAINTHGDYTDAWVRDNVYSILAIWGLALAFRKSGHDTARTFILEQAVVKLMRGLMIAMMRQSPKVERFKATQHPLDALHAKYHSLTGAVVVEDHRWGHLQIDATSLFLLTLAQMTASGIRIVFTMPEVCFIQNLVHYIGPAYRTPDFGIWERGRKSNDGMVEFNASSVGMAKAALEALQDFNLFGLRHAHQATIQVPPDEIARARITLEEILPGESPSKETDAALLSIIGFPAFSVEDSALLARTRRRIHEKLEGTFGCKRFLRDGHQTLLEDTNRLHYHEGELRRFEHIECEWPLFFCYLMLDAQMRGDLSLARAYRDKLEALAITRDGRQLLPELYIVPAERIAAEKAAPHSQDRIPNQNIPLFWAQSLYYLGRLLLDGLIMPEDIDPLNRRLMPGRKTSVEVQIALIASSPQIQVRLRSYGFESETLEQIQPVSLRHPRELIEALRFLGSCPELGLTGRAPRPLGSLMTSQAFEWQGQTIVFIPSFSDLNNFYFNLDNYILTERLIAELRYLARYWNQSGEPLLILYVTETILRGLYDEILIDTLRALHSGHLGEARVRVGRLAELLPIARKVRLDFPGDYRFGESPLAFSWPKIVGPAWSPASTHRVDRTEVARWSTQLDHLALWAKLRQSQNLCEQVELLGLLSQEKRLGLKHPSEYGVDISTLLESLYHQAGLHGLWGVVRRAAELLHKDADRLESAVKEMIVRHKQISIADVYQREALITRPLRNEEILRLIRQHGGSDPRAWVLIQEVLLFLGNLIKTEPALFDGIFTLRIWNFLSLLINRHSADPDSDIRDGFEITFELSPHEIMMLLRKAVASFKTCIHPQARHEPLPQVLSSGIAQRLHFIEPAGGYLKRVEDDWYDWRKLNGVMTRVEKDFSSRVWVVLTHCEGLIIGDPNLAQNRLESAPVLSDMTPSERNFALRLEDMLNRIHVPKYRQLNLEALQTLYEICRYNPNLHWKRMISLDQILASAVRRHCLSLDPSANYQEHQPAPWLAFYQATPDTAANAIAAAVEDLLR